MLTTFAHELGCAATARLSREEKRRSGQFMTPPAIARFMAQRLVDDVDLPHVRILEPSAGAGILAAATVEALLAGSIPPNRIELSMFEIDPRFIPALEALTTRLADTCSAAGVTFTSTITQSDFLLSSVAISGQPVTGQLIISNPPFFKLAKSKDERARFHAYAVHGQPNIYGLFMAACARLTGLNSKWCFIAPRSWMSGAYFGAARRVMRRHLTFTSLHAFESRRAGFEADAVLQETVIAWASARSECHADTHITLTRSQGVSDIQCAHSQALPTTRIVRDQEDLSFFLPSAATDNFSRWPATFGEYGLEVSTGPVVAFRAAEFIRAHAEKSTVPLLWLQHVGQQRVTWPIQKKREHIAATEASAWMMLPNKGMVLLRRFSPKEDVRRVTCAFYDGGLPGELIGLENHLNYIHRPDGEIGEDEGRGLAAFLASSLVDLYFRALAGSTQVNATDLRRLPLPPLRLLEDIGRRIQAEPSLADIDAVVTLAIGSRDSWKAAA